MSQETFSSYSADNDRRFRDALAAVRKDCVDLRVPLTLISKDFYRSERSIFNLKSAGQYPPISLRYAARKQRTVGFVYPLLVSSHLLEKSMTEPGHPMAVNHIVDKVTLVLGTKVGYGIFPQSDKPRRIQPQRKFLFIGPEAPKFASSDQVGRLERWTNILQSFHTNVLASRGLPVKGG